MTGGGIEFGQEVVHTALMDGMSFSKRSSPWANSGLVSAITAEDAAPFAAAGQEALAGLAFQTHIERKAAEMGGGDLVVPVQTAPGRGGVENEHSTDVESTNRIRAST